MSAQTSLKYCDSPHNWGRGYFQVSEVRVPESLQGPSPPPAGRQGRGGHVAQGRGGDGGGGRGGGDQKEFFVSTIINIFLRQTEIDTSILP